MDILSSLVNIKTEHAVKQKGHDTKAGEQIGRDPHGSFQKVRRG